MSTWDDDDEEDNASEGKVSINEQLTEPTAEYLSPPDTSRTVEEEDPNMDPVERITKHALRMCDLTYERAFAIDDYNLGPKLGEYTMARLFEIFIDRVYKDTDEWFRYRTTRN